MNQKLPGKIQEEIATTAKYCKNTLSHLSVFEIWNDVQKVLAFFYGKSYVDSNLMELRKLFIKHYNGKDTTYQS